LAAHRITHRYILETCLADNPVNRPPVALWRHFPVDDQFPHELAAAHLEFQRNYDFDFVKVTPASSFAIKDWGAGDEWLGAVEGTRNYTKRVIQKPDDWLKLSVLDPKKGYLANQLECLRMITTELGSETPVIQTIFNPLSQAKNLVGGGELLVHIRRYPEAIHAGLQIIAESTQLFIEAAQQAGIAGIFYAVQHARYDMLSVEEYESFGHPYDLQVLEPAREFWFNLLHLHGNEVMFDRFIDYPVAAINWHDQDTPPSLTEGKERFPGVVCGGLQRWETMVLGTPEKVIAEGKKAITATEGRRFILGTGCVTPTIAPRSNLLAARHCVEQK
jgi:uroporphyrinogen decarboxylase